MVSLSNHEAGLTVAKTGETAFPNPWETEKTSRAISNAKPTNLRYGGAD